MKPVEIIDKVIKQYTAFQNRQHPERVARPMTKYMQKHYKHELVGCEIGVASGENARNLFEMLPIKHLYLVDPYLPYTQYNNKMIHYGEPSKKNFAKNLKPYIGKYTQIEKPSEEASEYVPNNLDFVYIDGNHDYEHVKKDIELYYPKVKHGFVFGGHDFFTIFPGLCKAVIEFAERYDYVLMHHENYRYLRVGEAIDWWIIKD